VPELTGADHGREPGPDAGLPAVEAVRQDGPDVVVALTELAEQARDRAAPFPAPLLLDSYQRISPAHQAGPGAETGPAVIVFYRGGWCPYCNLALRTYQRELLPELGAFGARLVAISPQSPDQSLSTTEKAGLAFTVLSDPGSRVARSVGIAFQQADEVLAAQRQLGLDLAQVNAEGSTQLPRPTVLIIDQNRTVRFVDVQPDYTARTEVADILTALTGIRDGGL
jgi:peroxiredoxin